MKVPPRALAKGQSAQVWTHDTVTGQTRLVFQTSDLLVEAPNWVGEALILNGGGRLWRLPLASPGLEPIEIPGLPPLNNDHVPDPDGAHIFLSTNDDWQIYHAPLAGGAATRVTRDDDLLHFLHGVSPDGGQLAFVGVKVDEAFRFLSAEICTIRADGSDFRQLTDRAVADGPEYSPDGAWLYYNTEQFSGHAQIARMRPDGSGAERLSFAGTVDWFPHLSPDGARAVYLSYPPGTRGHPADLWVELKLVETDWTQARTVARLFGGQGTINVNSWSPDGRSFAFVSYPMADQ
ncbi:TolB family protein [Stagnihabitans tardus]|uniref:Biopolymer transporter Tol n=1 Tax=Stagnihabitans tardus TaxID=2699202 RepID=A0AAE4YE56_9RHOB|nr:PD40 domain-containing protein [Stagnihabitans tardus]NBZ90002.1 biopolymer transporter Tol [Stagnihabitans tardus]